MDSTDDGFDEIQVFKFQQFARASYRKPYQEDVHQSDRCSLRWSVVLELFLSQEWPYNHNRGQAPQKRPGRLPFPTRALQKGFQDQARLHWTLPFPESQTPYAPKQSALEPFPSTLQGAGSCMNEKLLIEIGTFKSPAPQISKSAYVQSAYSKNLRSWI